MGKPHTTPEVVRQLLNYDPETGRFTWKASGKGRRTDGLAGTNNKILGYQCIGIHGRQYWSHRLAWMHVYGVVPPTGIDHINGDKLDNRIANLRLASQAENLQNLRAARVNNATGFLGVYRHQDQFRARIQVQRKSICLGLHDTPEAAHAAYVEAKRRLHSFGTL